MGLSNFERRLERLVEGVFAKTMRTGLQPVELGRRLTRAMDAHRTVSVRGAMAPNVFRFGLSRADLDRFGPFADTLCRDLEDMARAHARDEGYLLVGPVEVTLAEAPSVPSGAFELAAELHESVGGGLRVVTPTGGRIPLGEEPVRIGRSPDTDIHLDDPNVSRQHAEIRWEDGQAVIVDLGSLNGTLVNGIQAGRQPLADGDEITIGATTLRVEAG